MKPSPPQSSVSIPLTHSINHRMNLYALAAGAAGLGMFAASAADAEIVYTPKYVRLTNGQLPIDINNDGSPDFYLSIKGSGSNSFNWRSLNVIGAFVGSSQNGVIGVYKNANALKPGQAIGSRQLFLAAPLQMAEAFNDDNSFFYVFGPFANKTDRFLGLRFTLNGQKYYGWTRFSKVTAGFNGSQSVVNATLTGYAYETIPGHQIVAGQTKGTVSSEVNASGASAPDSAATLGALALGARGLSIWRKESESASQ